MLTLFGCCMVREVSVGVAQSGEVCLELFEMVQVVALAQCV